MLVEPKHRMYLNLDRIETIETMINVEPKHRMYLNYQGRYSSIADL